MDTLIMALAPAFSAGFAVQRILEIFDSLLPQIEFFEKNKKIFLGIISIIIGGILVGQLGLTVLIPLGITNGGLGDYIVTTLIVSAGTEGFNSIMKFLGYAKEDKKATAAVSKKNAKEESLTNLAKAV